MADQNDVRRIAMSLPHYDGFPAVLVRLSAVNADELRELITAAWRCQAPQCAFLDEGSYRRLRG
jgi:hypothetical protein